MSSVALLGAGNVATHLGAALVANGHRVTGVYSRTAASADRLAGHLGCPGTDCLDRLTPGEWCIFAVKDDALPALAKRCQELLPHAPSTSPLGNWSKGVCPLLTQKGSVPF